MRGIAFSIAVSGLIFLAVNGITRASPIAPLAPGAANNTSAAGITPVNYYYHHYRHHHYWHYGFDGFDPTAYNWDYYRVDQPGRGTNVESTR